MLCACDHPPPTKSNGSPLSVLKSSARKFSEDEAEPLCKCICHEALIFAQFKKTAPFEFSHAFLLAFVVLHF